MHLVDNPIQEGTCFEIISLNRHFEITFRDGKWELTRNWKCPIERPVRVS